MLHATFETSLGTVDLWSEKSPDAVSSQDSYLIDERQQGLRLAVLDGVTPMTPEPWRLGLDRARYAAEITRAVLLADVPLKQALDLAQVELYRPEIANSRERSYTGVVAVDVPLDAKGDWAQVIIALDCEAWAYQKGHWQVLDPGDMLQPAARQAFQDLVATKDKLDFEKLLAAESKLLGDENCWRRTGVGQFEAVQTATFAISGWQRLVLASDGARIDARRLERLGGWMSELRGWEESNEDPERYTRHGDVTVLRLNAV